MSIWAAARCEARQRHDEAAAVARRASSRRALPTVSAKALIDAAARITHVERVPVKRSSSLLGGSVALYDPEVGKIWYADDFPAARLWLHLAHEYAHIWLDGPDGRVSCRGDDIDIGLAEPGATGEQRVAGYGPAELRERRANVFAREFLLPAAEAARLHTEGWTAKRIARQLSLDEELVLYQLIAGVLAPEERCDGAGGMAAEAGKALVLDESQRAAVEVARGPVLIEAGPGAGKTRTLTARILHLLERGVAPENILALTFSNSAAEEMRLRVALAAPAAAHAIWIGTFHAFALDLLRRFYKEAGLPPRFQVLDPVDALDLLAKHLPDLDLHAYRNVRAPEYPLRDILDAIARAQDEDASPERYAELAARVPGDAGAKAAEVARVYAWYESKLRERGQVDFGGLIRRTIALLREHPDVREQVRAQYQHILVDEYQDVNRASGLLLREIAAAGEGLWVVGDPRQAIYRFRGASPANVTLFARDFPGARSIRLRYNYRSRPEVLAAVAGFAAQLDGEQPAEGWRATRPAGEDGVTRIDAADRNSEARALAAEIERLRRAGIPYRQQAVLARSHRVLGGVYQELRRAGIPVLYFGSLFERPEVRDMLALLQLVAGEGTALARVAVFPEYGVPLGDILRLLRAAEAQGKPFPGALALVESLEELSPQGRDGLKRLWEQLEPLLDHDPWRLLARYLIERSNYLLPVYSDGHEEVERRLALFQVLQYIDEETRQTRQEALSPRTLLARVRWRVLIGGDRDLRQMPERAQSLEAVRLLTVHAAKGLEFSAVHVAGLAARVFPADRQPEPCPPPPGLIEGGEDAAAHDAEEQCLFFVAISRARDALTLAYPARATRQTRKPSPFLTAIDRWVTRREKATPESPAAAVGRRAADRRGGTPSHAYEWEAPETLAPTPAKSRGDGASSRRYELGELERYIACPRRYFYERRLRLPADPPENPHYRSQRVLRDTLRALWQGEIRLEDARLVLAERWERDGPRDHAYASHLRQEAEAIFTRIVAALAEGTFEPAQERHVQIAPDVVLRVCPDAIIQREGKRAWLWFRFRRSGRSPDRVMATLAHACREEGDVCYVSLDTGEVAPIEVALSTIKRALDDYERAAGGIARGRFPAMPEETRRCPVCPYFFICPA